METSSHRNRHARASSDAREKKTKRSTASLRIESGKTMSKMDMLYNWFCAAREKEDWPRVIQYANDYLRAWQKGGAHAPAFVHTAQLGLCGACIHLKQYRKALSSLLEIEAEALGAEQLEEYMLLLLQIHARTTTDTAPIISGLYEIIRQETADADIRAGRASCFDTVVKMSFTAAYCKQEEAAENYWRPPYTLFLPLEEQCDAGRAATILTTEDRMLIHRELLAVEDWSALPIEALAHAIQKGETFPIPEKPLTVETQDELAARMAEGENFARPLALMLPAPDVEDIQNLSWLRALLCAALQTCTWHKQESRMSGAQWEEHAQQNMALIRRFAALETVLLQRMYTPDMLNEENALLLPPIHRWGLYCALAFEALDDGDPNAYLNLLRRGLAVCTREKDMVQFLIDRLMEGTKPAKASPELLALAEKVRRALAACDPDDPKVQQIKESEAYKQTAWLIEPEPIEQMIQ